MNVDQLVKDGARLSIYFHSVENKNLKEAYEKLKPYKKPSDKIKFYKGENGLRWLKIDGKGYEIISLYQVEGIYETS